MAELSNNNNDILKDLEKIHEATQARIIQDPKSMKQLASNPTKITYTNFRELLDETNISVRPIIEAFCESYVTSENMRDNKVQQRMNVDSIALSEILWKKAITDIAIIQIMEDIESGDKDFKMYTALASLVSAKDNMAKELLQTVMVLEKNYKDLKSELFEQKKLGIEDIDGVNQDSLKFRGTRNLLEAIKNAKDLDESRSMMEAEQLEKENREEMIKINRQKPFIDDVQPDDINNNVSEIQ